MKTLICGFVEDVNPIEFGTITDLTPQVSEIRTPNQGDALNADKAVFMYTRTSDKYRRAQLVKDISGVVTELSETNVGDTATASSIADDSNVLGLARIDSNSLLSIHRDGSSGFVLRARVILESSDVLSVGGIEVPLDNSVSLTNYVAVTIMNGGAQAMVVCTAYDTAETPIMFGLNIVGNEVEQSTINRAQFDGGGDKAVYNVLSNISATLNLCAWKDNNSGNVRCRVLQWDGVNFAKGTVQTVTSGGGEDARLLSLGGFRYLYTHINSSGDLEGIVINPNVGGTPIIGASFLLIDSSELGSSNYAYSLSLRQNSGIAEVILVCQLASSSGLLVQEVNISDMTISLGHSRILGGIDPVYPRIVKYSVTKFGVLFREQSGTIAGYVPVTINT